MHEKSLIRSDLYLADEAFMTGTAAEVTPLRAVDDIEIGVGPITLEIQEAYLDTARGRSERWAQWLEYATPAPRRGLSTGIRRDSARPPAPRRAGGGARPRGAALRAALARADDRPLRGAARRADRRALRGRGLERHRGAAPALPTSPGSGPGDEAITSPISFVASANCFIFEGATPVFADVDPRTLNLDPAAVEAAITERTKAVVAVDMFGYPCELDELRAICSSGTGWR